MLSCILLVLLHSFVVIVASKDFENLIFSSPLDGIEKIVISFYLL